MDTPSSTEFRFQRLPTNAELNRLDPTSYSESYNSGEPDTNHVVRLQRIRTTGISPSEYEPIQHTEQRWPLRPEEWTVTLFYAIVGHAVQILLTLAPILFLMLAFAALSVDGQPLSHKGDVVLEAAQVSPTLFPIIFAAVVGRAMQKFALWKAEKGGSLGLLEQLNGSQNFLAAVERAAHLQISGGIGLMIILLWTLSPLGGQSSLRVLSVTQREASHLESLSYFDTENYTQSSFIGASAFAWTWPTVSAIYQACLLAPNVVISSSTDLWGNVKIPLMQAAPTYTGSPGQDWMDIPQDNTTYSSLTGIMISGLVRDVVTNLTIETGYFNLSCPDWRQIAPSFDSNIDTDTANDPYSEVRKWTGNLTLHSNTSQFLFSDPDFALADDTTGWSSFILDTNWNYMDPELVNQTDINVIFLSQNGDNDLIASAYKCSLGYTLAEARVGCDGLVCSVTQMRPSRSPHSPASITPFNQGFINYYNTLLKAFPWATGQQHSTVTSPSDWYISGSETPYNPSFTNAVYDNVTGSQVSQRLGALINTLWQTSMTQSALVQPHTADDTNNSTIPNYALRQAEARIQVRSSVYAANKMWVSFTIIISFIMSFCGFAGVFFQHMSTAPDILGYVSSLTRDNPYFHGPVAGDRLDGLARTRLLQNVVVQIGTVRLAHGEEHVALRSVAREEDKRLFRLNPSPDTPGLHTPI